jgi:uncharacterized protein (DUF885 family)
MARKRQHPWVFRMEKEVGMKVFDLLVDEILRERWQSSPVAATMDGKHDFDHLLDIYEPGFLTEVAGRRRRFVTGLQAIPDESLDLSRRIDKRVLLGALANSIHDLTVVQPWRRDPSLYLQTGLFGIYFLLARRFAPDAQRHDSALRRAEAFPGLLQEGKNNIDQPSRIFVATALAVVVGAKDFFTSVFFPATRAHDADRAGSVTASCLAALDDFEQFLTALAPTASADNFAIGKEAFEFKLKHEHGLAYSARQLLEIGEEARRDAVAQLEAVAEKIEPGVLWPELVDRLKNHHPTANGLLDAYRSEMRRAYQFVCERQIVTVPHGEVLEVVPTPAFDRPTTPYAALMPPAPFERDQRSFFYVTPVEYAADTELLREHCSYGIPATALHEAYPGHHLQLVLANRNFSQVRKIYSTPVMVEGWALYCEEMMFELGFYQDLPTRLFQLKDLLWRACRVVLDVQLHTGGMSPEAAVRYLEQEAHLGRAHAEAEVNRYCATPTQPMSYLIGRQSILSLRREAEMRSAAKFSLRRFHDEFLAWGSIPVALIREGLLSSPAFSKAA